MEDVPTGIPCLHSSLFKVLLLVNFQVDVRVNQYGTRLGKSLIVYYPAVIIIKKAGDTTTLHGPSQMRLPVPVVGRMNGRTTRGHRFRCNPSYLGPWSWEKTAGASNLLTVSRQRGQKKIIWPPEEGGALSARLIYPHEIGVSSFLLASSFFF